MVEDVTKRYLNTILRLLIAIKKMILFIEETCEYESPSKEYQSKWLELIDEELAGGQTEASFWKNKYKKY